MTDERDDLNVLFPQPVTVRAGGEEVTVRVLTMAEIPAASGILWQCFAEAKVKPEDAAEMDLPRVLAAAGNGAAALLGLICDRPSGWVSALPAGDGLRLTRAALEVNHDFFEELCSPAFLAPVFATAVKVLHSWRSFQASSPQATGSPTSEATPSPR
jgi:hypothetical protein